MWGLIMFFLQIVGAAFFVWVVSVKFYQLLTGKDSKAALLDMQYFVCSFLPKEKSFNVMTDEIFCQELGKLIEKYSSVPCHRTKWKATFIAGLPCIAFQVLCDEENKEELVVLSQELIRDCLFLNGYPDSAVLANWNSQEIPCLYLRYASTPEEHQKLKKLLEHEQLKHVPHSATDCELEKELERYENRF